jgi:hypothetical protein
VTDGGGALILVAAERGRDFPQKLAPGNEQGLNLKGTELICRSETVAST